MSYVLIGLSELNKHFYLNRFIVDKITDIVQKIDIFEISTIKSQKNEDLIMPKIKSNEGKENNSVPYLVFSISIKDFLYYVNNFNLANVVNLAYGRRKFDKLLLTARE